MIEKSPKSLFEILEVYLPLLCLVAEREVKDEDSILSNILATVELVFNGLDFTPS